MIVDDLYGSQQYRWFTGIVKEIADNDRVKVRIFGIHKMDDTTDVSDGDLPLAMVVYPTNSSGGGHALAPGKWVVGYFADGDDCQQPVVTGVLKGGSGAGDNSSSSPSGTATPGADGSATDTGTPTTNSSDSPAATASPTDLKGGSNVQKAYNFLYERIQQSGKSGGSIHIQTSALCAALLAESGCNPRAAVMDSNKWPSKGICQWNRERLWKLERLYGEASSQEDKNTKPMNCTLEQQLAYLYDELKGPENRAFNKLLASANPSDATDAMIAFERPGGVWKKQGNVWAADRSHPEYNKRLKGTMDCMSKLKYEAR
jgi:hypothetical protein